LKRFLNSSVESNQSKSRIEKIKNASIRGLIVNPNQSIDSECLRNETN